MFASPAMVSEAIAATPSGRNSGSSMVSAASATNSPLLVIDAKKFGPSPPFPPVVGGQIFTETPMITGTAASTARPAQLRRRPKISHSSERRNRVLIRRGGATAAGAASSATDIEALPGQSDERLLQVRREHPEPPYRHVVVHQ